MENYKEITAEVERIKLLLLKNPPLLAALLETCDKFSSRYSEFLKIRLPTPAMSHPHPVFKELRMEYVRISEVERELNKQYCIFWNKVDEALKVYEYVEKELRDIGRPALALDTFSHKQLTKLSQFFESDKNYALFKGLNKELPTLLADEWEHLFLIPPLNVCIHQMDALKTRMNSELETFAMAGGN